MIYGTEKDDIISYHDNNQNDVYLGNGNDVFYDDLKPLGYTPTKNVNFTVNIKDFGNNGNRDKINLGQTNTQISLNGNTIKRKFEVKDFYKKVTEASSADIVLEGDLGYIKRATDDINKSDSQIIIKR